MLLGRVARWKWPSTRTLTSYTHTRLWRSGEARLSCTPANDARGRMTASTRQSSNDAASPKQTASSNLPLDAQEAVLNKMLVDRSNTSSPRSPRSPKRSRSPPKSLGDYLNAKESLSVTNLTAPLWCEYAFQYGILGMSHLPIEQRPKKIVSIKGKTIRADKQTAEKREKVLQGGRVVHEKLERELYPVKVIVETKTREDAWALRLLKLVAGIEGLRREGCCRELPVFGFVHGKLVFGTIDEINRRPLTKRLIKYLDADKEVKATANTTTLHDFFPSSQVDKAPVAATPPRGKKWSTQEEWKREKRKSEALAKGSKSNSPAKKKTASGVAPSSGQASLTSFFAPPSATGRAEESVPQVQVPQERYGYYLEDSKTRYMRSLPPHEDQKASRLQCMMYKRMFDGLLAGFMDAPSQPAQRNRQAEVLEFDEYVTPIRSAELFAHAKVDATKTLSASFLQEALQLTEQYGLELGEECTLGTFVTMLKESLAQLALSARIGLDWQQTSPSMMSGVLQPMLRLTYRKRRDRLKRSNVTTPAATPRRVQPSRAAKHSTVGAVAEANVAPALLAEDQSHDAQIALALQMAVDAGLEDIVREEEILRDNGVAIPLNVPSTPVQAKAVQEEETPSKADKNIIGTVDFFHNAAQLDAHLVDIMKLWNGQREMRGVTLQQSGRCTACEFRQDCEWREEKQKEVYDGMVKKGLIRAAVQAVELEHDVDVVTHASINSDDDENALWSQFDDVDAKDLEW